MEAPNTFTFRGKKYDFHFSIDISADPCFVFVELKSAELIHEFGSEITLKTDFEKILPPDNNLAETPELIMVMDAIFDTLLNHPEFIHTKLKLEAYELIEEFNMATQKLILSS